MHPPRSFRSLALLFAAAGCALEGSTGVPLEPAAALSSGAPVEPRIEARVILPFTSVSEGTVWFAVQIINRLPTPVSSGACAARIDVKPVGARHWLDALPTGASCSEQLLTFVPGVPGTLSAGADLATMRTIVGGPGGTVVVRIRHVVRRGTEVSVVQSAEQEVVVP